MCRVGLLSFGREGIQYGLFGHGNKSRYTAGQLWPYRTVSKMEKGEPTITKFMNHVREELSPVTQGEYNVLQATFHCALRSPLICGSFECLA